MVAGGWAERVRGLLPVDVAMRNGRLISQRRKTCLKSPGNRHRSMTPAGAADPDVHIAAALSFEERNEEFKEAFQLPNECDGVGIGEHIGPYP